MKTENLPYDLREYIRREHRETCESNSCDYKMTSQDQLDGITREACNRYEAGKELIAKIDKADFPRLIRLSEYRRGSTYRTHDLVEGVVQGRRILAPRYVHFYDELLELRQVLA